MTKIWQDKRHHSGLGDKAVMQLNLWGPHAVHCPSAPGRTTMVKKTRTTAFFLGFVYPRVSGSAQPPSGSNQGLRSRLCPRALRREKRSSKGEDGL